MKSENVMIQWIDLSGHGLKLTLVPFTDGENRAVLQGIARGSEDWEWAVKNGFNQSNNPDRHWLIMSGHSIPVDKLLGRFPKGKRIETTLKAALQPAKTLLQNEQEIAAQFKATRFLGLNALGQRVYECPAGRFIRTADDEPAVSEDSASNPANFLRGNTPEQLALCAEGLVQRMLAGDVLRSDDLRIFAATVYGEAEPLPAQDQRLRQVQEAVEAATQREVEKMGGAVEQTFRSATRLLERQPPFVFRTSASMTLQQYSTPITLSVAAQHILGDTRNKSVCDPTIGNGSLVTCLPQGTSIVAVELDQARAEQAKRLRNNAVEVHVGDATQVDLRSLSPGKEGFDAVIANPPFGGLAKAVDFEDMRVTRLDHLILMRTLAARKADGVGVFVIGADHENIFPGKGGVISGGSANLFNWLCDHYETAAVEISGRLYGKQGATYPIRLVSVGSRRTPEEVAEAQRTKAFRFKGKLPVLHSWDEVWQHATEVAKQFNVAPAVVAGATIEVPPSLDEDYEDNRNRNDYQAPYVSASATGECTSMVPRNLQASTARALERLEAEVGTGVDNFVANKLQLTVEELPQYFSPEQIDAVALAIHKIDTGRGFISGDQTGMGKGRIAAAVARYGALNKVPVLFVTEKANLFNDFWRDVKDIGSDTMFTPFLLNDKSYIEDPVSRQKLYVSARQSLVSEMVGSGSVPFDSGYNLSMVTYSQFANDALKSAKSKWLERLCHGAILIADESHNAAGAGNTANNFGVAIESARGVIYSSATYAKGAKNFSFYSKAFPSTVQIDSLAETLEKGGEPLLEVVSAMLAEDGALIRREHDLSLLKFETVHDTDNLSRNEELADKLAPILSAMAYIGGDVDRVVDQANRKLKKALEKLTPEQRKGKRMGVQSVAFGSRLYTLNRQFLLAIMVDKAAELAIGHLRDGRKPVFVLEQTFESLLRDVIALSDGNDALLEEQEELGVAPIAGEIVLPSNITFRDVMHRTLDRLLLVSQSNGYGKVTKRDFLSIAADNGTTTETLDASRKAIERIREMINEFPDLPVSPIDTLRHKLAAEGYVGSEISGRSLQVEIQDDGGAVVLPRDDNRIKVNADYNGGKLDSLVLTRAGSTGISLHASEKFEDQRQRVLIELQIPNNVAERVQFFGRVNRKGQVVPPIIQTIASGLPAQERVLAMQNAKLRKLSANTQSNRNSAAESREVADILNEIGDKVAREFLFNNPGVARRLGVSLEDVEDSSQEHYYVNKLTGRIALLPVAEQRECFERLNAEFKAMIDDLDRRGKNPLKSRHLDISAKTVAIQQLLPGSNSGSAFDRPVFMRTISYIQKVDPIRSANVTDRIKTAMTALLEDKRMVGIDGEGALLNHRLSKRIGSIAREAAFGEKGIVKGLLSKEFPTVHEALNSTKDNAIKMLNERICALEGVLSYALPGGVIEFDGQDEERVVGVVAAIVMPDPGKECYLGQYTVRVAIPGQSELETMSMKALCESNPSPKHIKGGLMPAFDEVEAGEFEVIRQVIDGNLFRASELASRCGIGRSVTYDDENGVTQRGILMPLSFEPGDLASMMRGIDNPEQVLLLVRDEGVKVFQIGDLSGSLVGDNIIEILKDEVTIRFRGIKANVNALLPALDAVGVVAAGTSARMEASFPISDLLEFIDALTRSKAKSGCGLRLEVTEDDAEKLIKVIEKQNGYAESSLGCNETGLGYGS